MTLQQHLVAVFCTFHNNCRSLHVASLKPTFAFTCLLLAAVLHVSQNAVYYVAIHAHLAAGRFVHAEKWRRDNNKPTSTVAFVAMKANKNKRIFRPADLVLSEGRCCSASAVIGGKSWEESAHGFNLQFRKAGTWLKSVDFPTAAQD